MSWLESNPAQVDAALVSRFASIRLLVLDCDGVMTDGGLYYDPEGKVTKRFHVQDGLGIKLAQKCGLEIAVLSGLDQPAVAARIAELGVSRYMGGRVKKLPLVDGWRQELGLEWEHVAFMGDDWVDAAVMRQVGLSLAPANAQPEICSMAAWVSSKYGGHGAVRQAIAAILTAQGAYAQLWQEWLAS